MADYSPPDGNRKAGKRRGGRSGKVADFRYKRSAQPKEKRGAQQGQARGRARAKSPRPEHSTDNSHPSPAYRFRPRGKPPHARGPHPKQAYAALDLGTNNCRLLIARPSGQNFTVIDAFSRVV